MSKYGRMFDNIPAHFPPFDRSCARQELMQRSRWARAQREAATVRDTVMQSTNGEYHRLAQSRVRGAPGAPLFSSKRRERLGRVVWVGGVSLSKHGRNTRRAVNELSYMITSPHSTQRKAECRARAYVAQLRAERDAILSVSDT